MNNYLCVRLLNDKSHFIPGTKSYGNVDIRKAINEDREELNALKTSIKAFELSVNLENCPRLVTLVEAESDYDAYYKSDLVFNEMLDLFYYYSFGLNKTLMEAAGYMINLNKNLIIPIISNYDTEPYIPSTAVIHIIDEIFPIIDENQLIHNLERSDVVNRIYNSAYWFRQARYEKNKQLKILYYWFSIECLCKVKVEEDIIHKILLCLGFPSKSQCLLISISVLKKLNSIKNYRQWKNKIDNMLEEMRNYRNDSVHKGFRIHELTIGNKSQYISLLTLASSRTRRYYTQAIRYNLKTIEEIWEYLPILVEENSNLINDVQGNIIYSLENRL
ncbi:MAG: HEPN domain-containing protein [Ignavibacteriae bacterium]|nr:HEPN domain-containing protein [Ignavibacteriota bacterium]